MDSKISQAYVIYPFDNDESNDYWKKIKNIV